MPTNSLSSFLRANLGTMPKESNSPVWKGPHVDGMTQSMINESLFCKERFRIHVIDGIVPVDSFEPRIEYGNMWHILEECLAAPLKERRNGNEELLSYARKLAKQYPSSTEQIEKWYNVVKVQFPIYVNFWKKEKDVLDRTPIFQEEKFSVPYMLPSGRVFIMKGKWDSVDFIGKKSPEIYLQENKTKSVIDEESLNRQLTFDLQTMYYLVALREQAKITPKLFSNKPIVGVRYNVIKRPLSGGAGTIRPHKGTKNKPAETPKEFYSRLESIIKESDYEYFARWKVEVPDSVVKQYEETFLKPYLENVCDDYEWWSFCKIKHRNVFDYLERQNIFPHHSSRHYRLPYGIYNPIAEGVLSVLDDYLLYKNKAGLTITDNLFPEL